MGRLLFEFDSHDSHDATLMPGAGAVHPINGRFRDECLNDTLFSTLVEAAAPSPHGRRITTGTDPTRPSAT
jgi:hypothetical protein